MHVIVLPNNWAGTTEAYKAIKQSISNIIASKMNSAKDKPDLVVKVSAVSHLEPLLEKLNSNLLNISSKPDVEPELYCGNYKEFKNYNEDTAKLIRILLSNSSIPEIKENCSNEIQEILKGMGGIEFKSIEVIMDFASVDLAYSILENPFPFSNLGKTIEYHFIDPKDKIEFDKEKERKENQSRM
jgi:hypothetical protein